MATKKASKEASKSNSGSIDDLIAAGFERQALVPVLKRVATHEDLVDEEEGIALGKDDVTRSKLGGEPYVSASAPRPACERCDEPMHFVAQVRRTDLRTPFENVAQELVQVFWCDSCHGDNEEAFSPGTLVREIAMSEPAIAPTPDDDDDDNGTVVSFIEGWESKADYPSSLSDELRFMKVDKKTREAILDDPPSGEVLDGVKLSTWRRWTSAPLVVKCKCKLPMTWWLHLSDLGPTIGDGKSMGVLSCTCGRKALHAD